MLKNGPEEITLFYLCVVMSKRTLYLVSAFMGMAVIALIIMQSYWISNSIRVKEKQFSQLVNKSLLNIVNQIQQYDAVYHLADEMDRSVSFGSIFTRPPDTSSSVITRKDPLCRDGEVLRFRDSGTVIISGFSGHQMRIRTHSSLEYQSRQDIRNRIIDQYRKNKSFVENVIARMMSPDIHFTRRINPETLNRIISREFSENGIFLDYEFAVLNGHREIEYKSDHYIQQNEKEKEYFKTSLFPDNIFIRPNYLSVYFPGKKSFIIRSLGFMAISSIALTIIIILSFSLTLYIMFRQKKLSDIKNDFINNMTHELKTPISTISLASQMLNDSSIPSGSRNLSHIGRIIGEESRRLGYQVEKVLQMAIFDRSLLNLKMKDTDLHDIIRQVSDNFAIQLQNKEGHVEKELKAENPFIKADKLHMGNVISNLVDNAIKYSPDRPEITLSTMNRNNRVILRVQDRGSGIGKEEQKRIFEKFYRVPTGNIHNVKGFGLGLSYVRKITEAHNGQISLQSELGKGTIFELSFPGNRQNT